MTPCWHCQLREVGCHAKCKAYAEWKRGLEESKAVKVAEDKIDAYYVTKKKAFDKWGKQHEGYGSIQK